MKKIILLFGAVTVSAQCSFAQSNITWSAPMDVAPSSFSNNYPRITLDAAGNPMAIWGDFSTSNARFSRWNGSAFTTPVSLNPASIPVYVTNWTGPDIASKGDTVYAVFKKIPYYTNPSYVVRSFDGGINFSSPVQVDFIADSISWLPTIGTDAIGNPLVAYMKLDSGFIDSRWVVAKSINFGSTFLTDVKASGYSGATEVCDCCPGTIVSSSGKMTMLYRDNLSNIRDMWAGISTDNGNSFPGGINVDQNNWVISACPASGPDGVIVDDTLYSVFMSGASGKNLVYTNKNSLSTPASSTGNLITGNFAGLTQQNYPRIANYNSAVAIAWKQATSGGSQLGLFFTANIHSGFPAAYDTVAMGNFNSVINTDVAVFNGTIHLVWQDNTSGTVKYRKGTFSPSSVSQNPISSYSNLQLYPNPSNGIFTIQYPEKISGIEIVNVFGEEVIPLHLSPLGESVIVTLPSGLGQGIYFVKISNDKEIMSRKIVLMR